MRRLTTQRLGLACWRLRFVAFALTLAATSVAWLNTRRSDTAGLSDLLRAGKLVARLNDVPSHNRRYRASLVPASSGWTLRLATFTGEPISDATLDLQPWMPEAPSGSGHRPRVIALGNGTYGVDGLRFGRSGWWNVKLAISDSRVTDSLAFNIVIP